jgi:hypothetical protein
LLENSPRVNFPVVAPDPEKDSDVKYLTYPFYAVVTVVVDKFILLVKKVT